MVDYSTQNGSGKAPEMATKSVFSYCKTTGYSHYLEYLLTISSKRLDILSHIPCDSSRKPQSALTEGSGVVFLQTGFEEFEPALVMRCSERLASVELTVPPHHVPLVAAIAQQHLAPVGFDMRQMHRDIDLRNIQKHRGQ